MQGVASGARLGDALTGECNSLKRNALAGYREGASPDLVESYSPGLNSAGSVLKVSLGYTHQSLPQSEQMYLGDAMVPGAGSPLSSDKRNSVTATPSCSGTIVAVYGFVLSAQT
jgi:hypothetical protein